MSDNESELFISVISFAEIQFGHDTAPLEHRLRIAPWLADLRQKMGPATEEINEAILIRWKELLSDLKRRNRSVSCEDSLIAATALYCGHVVATHNKRHFEPTGVAIIDPLE
jgi:toxin FitB